MATWYDVTTTAQQERLLAAWGDAPIENLEVCAFILETARDQVLRYAPATIPTAYEPVTITWPDGSEATFTREGDIVTLAVIPSPTLAATPLIPFPVETFSPAGQVMMWSLTTDALIPPPGAIMMQISDGGALGDLGIRLQKFGDTPQPASFRWLADPAEGSGVPARYVYAQLQQARNLWNSGRTTGEGEVGADGYVFRPYPLDKTIKQMIRPVDGRPDVY